MRIELYACRLANLTLRENWMTLGWLNSLNNEKYGQPDTCLCIRSQNRCQRQLQKAAQSVSIFLRPIMATYNSENEDMQSLLLCTGHPTATHWQYRHPVHNTITPLLWAGSRRPVRNKSSVRISWHRINHRVAATRMPETTKAVVTSLIFSNMNVCNFHSVSKS